MRETVTSAAADDELHPPTPGDPFFTETVWFSFLDADRKMAGSIYFLGRPNLGVASLQAFVFDDRSWLPWELPYRRGVAHLQHPTTLRPLHLPEAGLDIDVLEPG